MAIVIILVQIVDIMAMSSWDTQGCRDKDCDGDYHDKFDDVDYDEEDADADADADADQVLGGTLRQTRKKRLAPAGFGQSWLIPASSCLSPRPPLHLITIFVVIIVAIIIIITILAITIVIMVIAILVLTACHDLA